MEKQEVILDRSEITTEHMLDMVIDLYELSQNLSETVESLRMEIDRLKSGDKHPPTPTITPDMIRSPLLEDELIATIGPCIDKGYHQFPQYSATDIRPMCMKCGKHLPDNLILLTTNNTN